MLIRQERPSDIQAVRAATAAAFERVEHAAPPVEPDGAPGEATLVGWLRDDPGWVPELSLVAESGSGAEVVGHVIATHGRLADRPALGLGPLSVRPAHQGRGIGSALMHTLLGAADAMGEPVVVLLGDPALYSRFGFVPADGLGIEAPDPAWVDVVDARTGSRDPLAPTKVEGYQHSRNVPTSAGDAWVLLSNTNGNGQSQPAQLVRDPTGEITANDLPASEVTSLSLD